MLRIASEVPMVMIMIERSKFQAEFGHMDQKGHAVSYIFHCISFRIADNHKHASSKVRMNADKTNDVSALYIVHTSLAVFMNRNIGIHSALHTCPFLQKGFSYSCVCQTRLLRRIVHSRTFHRCVEEKKYIPSGASSFCADQTLYTHVKYLPWNTATKNLALTEYTYTFDHIQNSKFSFATTIGVADHWDCDYCMAFPVEDVQYFSNSSHSTGLKLRHVRRQRPLIPCACVMFHFLFLEDIHSQRKKRIH